MMKNRDNNNQRNISVSSSYSQLGAEPRDGLPLMNGGVYTQCLVSILVCACEHLIRCCSSIVMHQNCGTLWEDGNHSSIGGHFFKKKKKQKQNYFQTLLFGDAHRVPDHRPNGQKHRNRSVNSLAMLKLATIVSAFPPFFVSLLALLLVSYSFVLNSK